MFYPYLLLIHIVSVCGLFIALSLEVIIVSRLNAAQTTLQVQEWLAPGRVIDLALPVSAVLILVSGLAMTWIGWGRGQAWIIVSLAVLVLLGGLGPVINGPRMKAIHVAVQSAPVGEISPALHKAIKNPVLRAYIPVPIIAAVGAVAMMVLKLDWTGAGIVIALILIVSLIQAFVRKG